MMAAYQNEIEMFLVQEFVVANKRAPTEEELTELKKVFHKQSPSANMRGIFAAKGEMPQLRRESSASKENTRRRALYTDILAMTNRMQSCEDKIRRMSRDINSGMKKASLAMDRMLLRIDALTSLLNGSLSPIISVEESFDRAARIASGTLDLSAGRVLLGKSSNDLVDLTDAEFKISTDNGPGFIGSYQINNVKDMYLDNGKYWQRIGMSNVENTYSAMKMDWLFRTETYVSEVEWAGMSNGSNGRYSVLYTTDRRSWNQTSAIGQSLRDINIGVVGQAVLGIRIIIEKDRADTQMDTGAYGFIYAFDKFKMHSSYYESTGSLVLGPYPVKDAFNQDYSYTTVAMEACVVEDDETQVSMFVSNDGSTWVSIDYEGGEDDFVVLGNASTLTLAYLDTNTGANLMLAEHENIQSFTFNNEAILNSYASNLEVVPHLVVLQRNIKDPLSLTAEVNGAPRGWRYEEGEWYTTIYTSNDRKLDVGPNAVKINGTDVAGVINIPAGIHRVVVQDANWHALDITLVNAEQEIIEADPLYPYNHRYLFDGLTYATDFEGTKVYQGMDEVYGARMRYIPMEAFVQLDESDEYYFEYFSILYEDNSSYFVVKVDKTHGTWQEEEYNVTWSEPNGTSNLYVKVDMETSDTTKSPILFDFVAKVV